MHFSLFLKECRKILFSIPYLAFVVILFIFFVSQGLMELRKTEMPLPGSPDYGTKYEDIPEIIMPAAIDSLMGEYFANSYTAYPIGFYKNVKLNDSKQAEMAQLLAQLTGSPVTDFNTDASAPKSEGMHIEIGNGTGNDNLVKNEDGSYQIVVPDKITPPPPSDSTKTSPQSNGVNPALSYTEFRALMNKADRLIGGGSKYNDLYIIRFGTVPVSYEEALVSYQNIVETDRISGAYARLFADYMCIMLAILPVFVAVGMGMKDRHARMQDLIYGRHISSLSLVLMRWLSMLAMMILPILLLALYETISVAGLHPGMAIDPFAFFTHSFGWLLPTLMVSVSVGMFLTELTNTPIAIAVQGIWFFADTSAGMWQMDGGYRWYLIPRHNEIGNTQVFIDNFNVLVVNRICYAALAVLLVLLTVGVYELKRRGILHGFDFKKILGHRFHKSKI